MTFSHMPLWTLLVLLLISAIPHQAIARDARAIATTVCIACHGADGNSTDPAYPKIAGMGAAYLLKQLRYFSSGQRRNEVMETIIADINEADFPALANYFSAQKPLPGKVGSAKLAAVGQRLFEDGNSEKGVPACAGCHQSDGGGNARFPRLAGQHQMYTLQQLDDFHSGRRATDRLMVTVAQRLNKDEMKALAEFVAGLGAAE